MDGIRSQAPVLDRIDTTSLRRVALSLAFGVALVLTATKLTLLPFPVESVLEFMRWLLRLAVVSSADLLFVAGLLATSLMVIHGVARLPGSAHSIRRRQRVLHASLIAAFQTAALYGILSVPLFRMTMVPLTVQLLSFSGGPGLMASSVGDFVTWSTRIALLAVPLVLLGLTWLAAGRWGERYLSRMGSKAVAIALLLVVVQAIVCRSYIRAQWTDPNRWERRIAVSPHAALLDSCWDELLKRDHLTLSFDPVDVDESDFEPREAQHLPHAATSTDSITEPRNLIVIVLESVGASYLDIYGGPHRTMPHLQRRAEQGGIVFEDVYAHAASSPKGLVALTTSVVPRVDWKLITRDCPAFDVPSLPAVLHERGYRSCYLHSGHWNWKRRDEFLRARGVHALIDADSLPSEKVFSWGISDQAMFEAGLAWIDEQPEAPFHMLLWTIETHHPYLAGGDPIDFGVDDEELNRYLNAIRQADARIEWLMNELARRGLAESTVVAVTGDHGEVFGQHNQRVHSFGIYQENVRVPLVVLHPGLLASGVRQSGACQQIDIPATLLGLLEAPRPTEWQGRDVLNEGPAPRAYFFSTGNEVILGLREGRYKYHYHLGEGFEELFDLQADPREQVNLAAQHTERCASYRSRVGGLVTYQRAYLARHGAP